MHVACTHSALPSQLYKWCVKKDLQIDSFVELADSRVHSSDIFERSRLCFNQSSANETHSHARTNYMKEFDGNERNELFFADFEISVITTECFFILFQLEV